MSLTNESNNNDNNNECKHIHSICECIEKFTLYDSDEDECDCGNISAFCNCSDTESILIVNETENLVEYEKEQCESECAICRANTFDTPSFEYSPSDYDDCDCGKYHVYCGCQLTYFAFYIKGCKDLNYDLAPLNGWWSSYEQRWEFDSNEYLDRLSEYHECYTSYDQLIQGNLKKKLYRKFKQVPNNIMYRVM